MIFAEAEKIWFDTMFGFLALNIGHLQNLDVGSVQNLSRDLYALNEKHLSSAPEVNKYVLLQPHSIYVDP